MYVLLLVYCRSKLNSDIFRTGRLLDAPVSLRLPGSAVSFMLVHATIALCAFPSRSDVLKIHARLA